MTKTQILGLTGLLVAEAMNLLDSTIVQVVAPTIHRDLPGPIGQVQWFSNAYTLPFALLLIAGGRLGDLAGRRRVFRIGVAVFLAASLACALAPTAGALIAFRVVQGAAAAAIIPQTIGLIKAMFAGAGVARALGTIGPVMGLAAISGPMLGGVLTESLSWRAAFLVNVPLSLAVRWLSRPIPEDRAPRRAGRPPLVEPSLFRQRAFPAALATSTLFFAVTTGLSLVVVLHSQLGEGHGVLAASLTLLPWTIGMGAASLVSGARLVARYGDRLMTAALAVLLAGVLGAVAAYHLASEVPLLLALAVAGAGVGLFTPAFFTGALHVVGPHEVGSAAGLLNSVQQLGATLGVAALGGIYLHGPHATAAAEHAFWAAGATIAVLLLSRAGLRAPAAGANSPA